MYVSMCDVVLYPYDDVAASVATLTGIVLPEHPPKPIVMDDLTSYRIDTDYAELRLTAEDMTRLMDRHVLPSAQTPIKRVNVAFGEGQISMSGTIVKLGVPVPFTATATATLEPTPSGDLRVHVTSMLAAGVIPKGLIDALGLQLSTLAACENRRFPYRGRRHDRARYLHVSAAPRQRPIDLHPGHSVGDGGRHRPSCQALVTARTGGELHPLPWWDPQICEAHDAGYRPDRLA